MIQFSGLVLSLAALYECRAIWWLECELVVNKKVWFKASILAGIIVYWKQISLVHISQKLKSFWSIVQVTYYVCT